MNSGAASTDKLSAVAWVLDKVQSDNQSAPVSVHHLNDAISSFVQQAHDPVPIAEQRLILTSALRRLAHDGHVVTPVDGAASGAVQGARNAQHLRRSAEIMDEVSANIDFAAFSAMSDADKTAEITMLVRNSVRDRRLQINAQELEALAKDVINEMMGYGPLQPLLDDESVTDIMVNGADRIYLERNGKIEKADVSFRDDTHVLNLASRIVSEVGRRIDESQPLVDARLKDGSRVNIVIPPLAIDGPAITIRKFPAQPMRLRTLVEKGALTRKMAAFLALAAEMRLNILVSGGTGSGKTTLLNAMSECIPRGERIVTLEDAAELQLQQGHVVRFETRPPSIEGRGEITMRTLLRNALRMRPDRIIIGEIRGEEALDLLQAMNTGHDGSMSTLHANSPREALTRIEGICALANYNHSPDAIRRQLADAVNLIIQVSRMRDGTRRVTSVSEVTGLDGGVITLQDIFTFRIGHESGRNTVSGEFHSTGYRPMAASRAAEFGLSKALDDILRG
ncbi:CpaF family protein [Roseinatronobacter sp.]